MGIPSLRKCGDSCRSVRCQMLLYNSTIYNRCASIILHFTQFILSLQVKSMTDRSSHVMCSSCKGNIACSLTPKTPQGQYNDKDGKIPPRSCNPETKSRDIDELSLRYRIILKSWKDTCLYWNRYWTNKLTFLHLVFHYPKLENFQFYKLLIAFFSKIFSQIRLKFLRRYFCQRIILIAVTLIISKLIKTIVRFKSS